MYYYVNIYIIKHIQNKNAEGWDKDNINNGLFYFYFINLQENLFSL